jgi:hypothetical protein
MRDPLTKYPISAYRTGFVLKDREGRRINFHRTVSGVLQNISTGHAAVEAHPRCTQAAQ